MRKFMPLFAAVLSVVLVACAQRPLTPTAKPVERAPTTSAAPTTRPTAVPGPGGVAVPVFAQPYPFGTVQAQVPPTTDGLAPVVRRVRTDQPYVFITVDDGAVRHPKALDLIRLSEVRPTLFLNTRYVEGHGDYFTSLRDRAEVSAQAHSATHPDLSGKPYETQKQEICGNADFLAGTFGVRPTLFRPPFGNHDLTTRRAAADCGMSAIVLWTASVNDGVVQFQAGDRLNAGDIVLMHFRDSFAEDYLAFLNRARQDGLTPVVLEDFLAGTPPKG